jgi:hypothetical protein
MDQSYPQADFDWQQCFEKQRVSNQKKVTKCPLMTNFRRKKTEWDTLESLSWQGREGLRNNNAVSSGPTF